MKKYFTLVISVVLFGGQVLFSQVQLNDTLLAANFPEKQLVDSSGATKNAQQVTMQISRTGFSQKLGAVESDFDKIYLIEDEAITAKVIRVKADAVQFIYPLNTRRNEIKRKQIHKIIYSYGKLEVFNDKDPEKGAGLDETFTWEDVTFTEKPGDVSGMMAGEEMVVTFDAEKFNQDIEYLVKNAKIILAKKAFNAGAQVVFINDKYIHQAYGELPFVKITGTVYSIK